VRHGIAATDRVAVDREVHVVVVVIGVDHAGHQRDRDLAADAQPGVAAEDAPAGRHLQPDRRAGVLEQVAAQPPARPAPLDLHRRRRGVGWRRATLAGDERRHDDHERPHAPTLHHRDRHKP
jgi:hypothetical protein